MTHRRWWAVLLVPTISACGPPPHTSPALPPGVDRAVLGEPSPGFEAEATGENPRERLLTQQHRPAHPLEPDTPPSIKPIEERTLPSGLKIQIFQAGSGAVARTGQAVDVHYTGWVDGGRKFDSSRDGDSTYRFTPGEGAVIQGWDEGVPGMKVGERRRLTIPPALGYGSRAQRKIPADSTLIFDIELMAIDGAAPTEPARATPEATPAGGPARPDPFADPFAGPTG